MNPNKNHETEVKNLRELIDCLQKENLQLKELLEQAGIDYSACMGRTIKTLSVSDEEKEFFPLLLQKMWQGASLQDFGAGRMFMRNGA